MKAVILDALDTHEDMDISRLLTDVLGQRGWETRVFPISEMDVKPCSSCGHCAAKTPGRCSIADDMEEIYRAWANCRLIIFSTPVSFGGYSSKLKLVQDRFMPMNTALFTVRKGELHHENRYRHALALMTVGLLEDNMTGEKEAFKYLTERNAINMNIDRWVAVVLEPGDRSENEMLPLLEQAIEEVV